MRGTVLGYDATTGDGVVADASGVRHHFGTADWKSGGIPATGQAVDYSIAGDRATDVYAVPGAASATAGAAPSTQQQQAQTAGIIALIAGLCSGIPLIGLVGVVLAFMYGIKAKNLGQGLPTKGPYYMGIIGMVLAGMAILFYIIFLFGCGGCMMLGAMSGGTQH